MGKKIAMARRLMPKGKVVDVSPLKKVVKVKEVAVSASQLILWPEGVSDSK